LKYCIFSDIHGNYINLVDMFKSTINLNIDKYICLGDVCNYYTDNKKVIDFLIDKNIDCVLGNHDELYMTTNKLSKKKIESYNFDYELRNSYKHIDFLRNLPDHIVLEGHQKVLLCHGSPNNFTNEYIYPDSKLTSFEDCGYDIVFFGHTHRQFLKKHKNIIFCNVGSVGQPRDNGLLFGFVTFDSEQEIISLYRKHSNKSMLLNSYGGIVPEEVIQMLDRNELIDYPYILIL
jgi:putative phosphoesterase